MNRKELKIKIDKTKACANKINELMDEIFGIVKEDEDGI